jgi:hypothetical protein
MTISNCTLGLGLGRFVVGSGGRLTIQCDFAFRPLSCSSIRDNILWAIGSFGSPLACSFALAALASSTTRDGEL